MRFSGFLIPFCFFLVLALPASSRGAVVGASDGLPFEPRPVVIGVSEGLSEEALQFLSDSVDRFLTVSGEVPVLLRILPDEALLAAVKDAAVDLTFSSARLFAILERFFGSRPLLSALPAESTHIQKADGLTILIPGSLETTDDKALLRCQMTPYADKALVAEFEPRLRHFCFAEFGSRAPAVRTLPSGGLRDGAGLSAGSGPAVVLLPACALERHGVPEGGWRVWRERFSPELACRITTEAIPGPVLGQSLGSETRGTAGLVGYFLGRGTEERGWRWRRPANFQPLHERLSACDDLYRAYARPGLAAIWRRFSPYIAAGALLLLVVLGFAVRSERRLKLKSEALVAALKEKEWANSRFSKLERVSIVGQMSTIVAHEIRQPLGAVRNYLGSLRLRTKRGEVGREDLKKVLDLMVGELGRADQIVERVRTYAKTGTARRERFSFSELAVSTAGALGPAGLELSVEPDIFVCADRLEMRLVVENLLRNAQEAAAEAEGPARIVLRLRSEGKFARLTVSDNGPRIPEEVFSLLSTPLFTTKTQGTGLGLAIVSSVLRSCGGSMAFSRPETGPGITITAFVPLAGCPKEPENG